MPVTALKRFLDQGGVNYQSLSHSPAYTAQEVAHCAHICGNTLAKTVVTLVDDGMALIVMPATARIHWDRFIRTMATDFIELADEDDFDGLVPECETGAIPPFERLCGLPVYMDESMTSNATIAISGGTHHELVTLSMKDYLRLAQPYTLCDGFSHHQKRKRPH